jgi:hypothetical protein
MSFSGPPNDPGLNFGKLVTLPAPYTLVNGTGNFLTVSVPNDGQEHYAVIVATQVVSSLETGGQIRAHTTIAGADTPSQLFAGGSAAGTTVSSVFTVACDPGTNVILSQDSALTAGAAQITKASVYVY